MKKQLFVLFPVTLMCMGIWIMVFLSFSSENTSPSQKSEGNIYDLKDDEVSIIVDDNYRNGKSEFDSKESSDLQDKYYEEGKNLVPNAIYPGDFDEIAPNKIISIDKLLELVLDE
ncbi:hypothetical protein [Evansella tamaricis]|uniref:Uncharacterized protein n=1 Tax=Evansella tamaricis TaxID=2069301 RepID=A0ABS6JLW8_9BACI|nr:hypothetical protein [Evansella tamaricis]MBU9714664.1 hypothetical protein [Evansella tamaricis]